MGCLKAFDKACLKREDSRSPRVSEITGFPVINRTDCKNPYGQHPGQTGLKLAAGNDLTRHCLDFTSVHKTL